MLKDLYRGYNALIDELEYKKGCPACEHTNPALERELRAFAQLFFEIYLEAHGFTPPDKPEPH